MPESFIEKMRERALIMGILNVTPNSFSDGGQFMEAGKALLRAQEMEAEGADIIDIGGESTHPKASPISEAIELERVLPIIKLCASKSKVPLSIDTYKSNVARKAIEAGASIINDVGGLQRDPKMAEVAAELGCPIIIMHNEEKGDFDGNILIYVMDFLKKSIAIALEAGIKPQNIILDPGIGFGGKLPEDNLRLLKGLCELKSLGFPVLLGFSKKSTLGYILGLPSSELDEATLATTAIGVMHGADIIRVHEVKSNLRAVKIADAILKVS